MSLVLPALDPAALAEGARRLAAGSLVGMPTETVYGLGADAANASAVQRIFAAKGRPSDHPLIVHLPAPAGAREAVDWAAVVAPFAQDVPPMALALMKAFWPGPLTLILPRRPDVGAVAAGGQDSIGVRCPAHPAAQALLVAAREAGVSGVAAPSANRFGRVSPTTATHVAEEFEALSDDELLILDAGACPVGIESTIIDCTRGAPVLLRPGMVTADQVASVCGQAVYLPGELAESALGDAPRASGTLESHYAPTAKVRLMDGKQLQSALEVLGPKAANIAVYARTPLKAGAGIVLRRMPSHAADVAHELFAVLRTLDQTGVKLIWVESPPEGADWDGVRDRLQRAAA